MSSSSSFPLSLKWSFLQFPIFEHPSCSVPSLANAFPKIRKYWLCSLHAREEIYGNSTDSPLALCYWSNKLSQRAQMGIQSRSLFHSTLRQNRQRRFTSKTLCAAACLNQLQPQEAARVSECAAG
jgi:hypothetical protein